MNEENLSRLGRWVVHEAQRMVGTRLREESSDWEVAAVLITAAGLLEGMDGNPHLAGTELHTEKGPVPIEDYPPLCLN